MANGEQPPLRKDDKNVALTPGMLRILNRQVINLALLLPRTVIVHCIM